MEESIKIEDTNFLEALKTDPIINKVKEWVVRGKGIKDPMMLEPTLRRYHNKIRQLTVNDQGLLCRIYYFNKCKSAKMLICIPESMRENIIQVHHDIVGCHQSTDKTLDRIMKKYWMPNLAEEVKLFCQTCPKCIKVNLAYHKKPIPVMKSYIYNYPNICVMMDCLKIEKGSNNTLVLTMIDRCTKWTKFACIPNEKAVTIATAFFNNWVSIFSAPQIIITEEH